MKRPGFGFSRLLGAAFAIDELCPPVPGMASDAAEIRSELARLAVDLNVRATLQGFGRALAESQSHRGRKSRYFLLTLTPVGDAFQLSIRGFGRRQAERAAEEYSLQQRQASLFPSIDSVLVAVSSLDALRRSYPVTISLTLRSSSRS